MTTQREPTGSGCVDCRRGAGGAGLRAASGESYQEAQRSRRRQQERAASFGGEHLRSRKRTRDWGAPAFGRDHESKGAGGARAGFENSAPLDARDG